MKNKYRVLRLTRNDLLRPGLLAAMAVLLIALPVASNAQEITGTIRGTVTTSDGLPAAGATVTITDTRTNTRRTVSTGANGAFTVRGLGIGGPFNIRVASSQYQDTLVTDVYTNLSSAVTFDIALGEAGAIEEIITTARMVQTADLAIGPGSSFSLADIEAMPSIARQIRDIVRTDPYECHHDRWHAGKRRLRSECRHGIRDTFSNAGSVRHNYFGIGRIRTTRCAVQPVHGLRHQYRYQDRFERIPWLRVLPLQR